VNVDQLEPLQRFAKKFPSVDHVRIISSVEEAIALVGRNVYLPLVLANLAYRLKEATGAVIKGSLVENEAE
jgi:hypothetical protein